MWQIELEPTTDVLKALGERRTNGQVLVGFAAETGAAGLERARMKLAAKRVDLIVYNDVSRDDVGFDAEENEVVIVSAEGSGAWRRRRRPRSRRRSSTRWSTGSDAGRARRNRPVGGRHPPPRREPRQGRPRAGRDAPALRPLPRQRGAPDHRGLPGRGEDDAREGDGALARLLLLAPPVHARPAPVRRHRRQRLQPALERVRVPAWPDLREPPPRRRDQPRPTEDAGGAPRVHAGEPGDDRRRQLRARPPVHGHGDAEPDRVRGHVPAARGAARPLHDADRHRLPAAGAGGAHARRADERPAARGPRAGDERDRDRRGDRRGDAHLRRGEPAPLRRRRSSARRATTRASTSAPARARGSPFCAWRRPALSATSATTCCPTTSRPSPRRCSRTGSSSARRRAPPEPGRSSSFAKLSSEPSSRT